MIINFNSDITSIHILTNSHLGTGCFVHYRGFPLSSEDTFTVKVVFIKLKTVHTTTLGGMHTELDTWEWKLSLLDTATLRGPPFGVSVLCTLSCVFPALCSHIPRILTFASLHAPHLHSTLVLTRHNLVQAPTPVHSRHLTALARQQKGRGFGIVNLKCQTKYNKSWNVQCCCLE